MIARCSEDIFLGFFFFDGILGFFFLGNLFSGFECFYSTSLCIIVLSIIKRKIRLERIGWNFGRTVF